MDERLRGAPLPNQQRKNMVIIISVVISLLIAAFIVIAVFLLMPQKPPKNLQQTTGTVTKVDRYEAHWLDYVLPGEASSYYKIWLANGLRAEARGDVYDLIDRSLFTDLRLGDEITITYEQKRKDQVWHIYAIEYHGVEYLRLEEALATIANWPDKADKFLIILALIVLPVVLGGFCLFFLNYSYAKGKNLRGYRPKE